MHPDECDYPLCDEHARAHDLAQEANDWVLAEEITRNWLRIAGVWGLEELEQLAINAYEDAKQRALKAQARTDLAIEITDAPRKGSGRQNLT
jgi:hypothetical protein